MTAYVAKTLVTAVLLACSTKYSGATCTTIAIEQNDNADPAIGAKKADYAMAVISDAGYLARDKECVRSAMMYLGSAHVEKAIPRLIALLGYHQEPRPGHMPRADDEYPSIAALFRMGKPAVPALIEVIAAKDNDTIEGKNALYALMSVYREDPSEGIRALKKATQRHADSLSVSRLRQAIQDARSLWCRSSPCSE